MMAKVNEKKLNEFTQKAQKVQLSVNVADYVESTCEFLKNYLPLPKDHIKQVVIVSFVNAVGGQKALNMIKEIKSHILSFVGELRDNCSKVLGDDDNYTINLAMDGLVNKYQVF